MIMFQKEYFGSGSLRSVGDILKEEKYRHIFFVRGGKSYSVSGAEKILEPVLKGCEVEHFTGFSPNPKLEDVERGIEIFNSECDVVVAVGGGSVIDMAKLINIFFSQEGEPSEYIKGLKKIRNKGRPLIAVPTTAGSGSEATHFAVVYVNGVKHSVAHEYMLPTYAIVDPELTKSMPKEIAASTGMDAFAQAVESFWSVNSTDISKKYSERAIMLAVSNLRDSVNRRLSKSRARMSEAAHFAGKAINIAKTTASHALSYTLTSNFGIPHGHAVALTLGSVLKYNSEVSDEDCNDRRGAEYVSKTIHDLYSLLNVSDPDEAKDKIENLMEDIGLETHLNPIGVQKDDIEKIAESVNYQRLSNNPRKMTMSDMISLLKGIL